MTFTPCPSPSALRMATARAAHQIIESEIVFEDPFAIASIGATDAAALIRDPTTHNSTPSRSLRAGIIARTRMSEDRLLKAISEGTRQYAVVGAGLDTWALRNAHTLPAVTTYELDQPLMQEWKTGLHAANRWTKPPSLRYIACDLREKSAADALASSTADISKPISLSILGVLVYLDCRVMAREIEALGKLAPGSTVTLDYRLDAERLHPVERSMMQYTADLMAAGGEPWRSSSTPEAMKELLASAGFEVEEDLGPGDLNDRYLSKRRDGLQIAGAGFRYLSAVKSPT